MGLRVSEIYGDSGQPGPLAQALALLAEGFWPVAIKPGSKAPIGNEWGRSKPTEDRLRRLFSHHPGAGVGIKLGKPGGVIDFDFDDPEPGDESFMSLMGNDEIETRGWSNSDGRFHLLARWDDRLAAFDRTVIKSPKLPGLEIRIGALRDDDDRQLQTVVPPTPTDKGEARRWNGISSVMILPDEFFARLAEVLRQDSEESSPRVIPLNIPGALDRYVCKAITDECEEVAATPEGARNDRLNIAAYNLGRLVGARALDRSVAVDSLLAAASQAGLGDKESAATIRSGIEAGIKKPRDLSHVGINGNRASVTRSPIAAFIPDPDTTETTGRSGRSYKFPLIIRGRDVVSKDVRWLWEDRIPYGFLTLMAGRTGVGKSFTTCDVAARITRGDEVPEGNGLCFTQGSILIISEDSHEYMLAPRLIEAGADMDRVSFMSWEAMADFTLSDAQMLDDVYFEAGEPKLVVIDPPTNFLGNKDEHRNAEVRGVLMGVSIWSMKHDVATVLITHCNKGIKKDMAALDRIIGSVAWASTSRIAHIFSPHPEDRSQSVFIPMKNNLGPLAKGLSYRVAKTTTFAKVEWLGPVDFDADDAMSGDKKKPRGVVAVEWLAERFGMQREWRSDELKKDAAEAGLSKNALWSPEALALPIRKMKRTDAAGESHWFWVAEDGWPPESNDAGNVGNLGNVDRNPNEDNTY